MALVNGTDLRIFVGTGVNAKKIAFETSCDIELSTTMIETSSKDSGAWETSIPGRKSWGLSATIQLDYNDADTTVYTYDELLTAWLNQTALSVSFKTSASGATLLKGTAYIESKPVQGGDMEIATVDITLRGTGELEKETAA
jgi:predicted secreted protein